MVTKMTMADFCKGVAKKKNATLFTMNMNYFTGINKNK